MRLASEWGPADLALRGIEEDLTGIDRPSDLEFGVSVGDMGTGMDRQSDPDPGSCPFEAFSCQGFQLAMDFLELVSGGNPLLEQ